MDTLISKVPPICTRLGISIVCKLAMDWGGTHPQTTQQQSTCNGNGSEFERQFVSAHLKVHGLSEIALRQQARGSKGFEEWVCVYHKPPRYCGQFGGIEASNACNSSSSSIDSKLTFDNLSFLQVRNVDIASNALQAWKKCVPCCIFVLRGNRKTGEGGGAKNIYYKNGKMAGQAYIPSHPDDKIGSNGSQIRHRQSKSDDV